MTRATAREALSTRVVHVAASERARKDPDPALAGVIYAVSDPDREDAVLGLVPAETAAAFPGRIFADLLRRRELQEVDAGTPLDEVALRMSEERSHAFVVTDQGEGFQGVVTRASLLEALLDRESELRDEAQVHRQRAERALQRIGPMTRRLRSLNHAFRELLSLIAGMSVETEVLQQSVGVLTALVGARYGALALWNEERQLESFFHVGLSPAEAARISRLPRGEGLLGLGLVEGADPVVVEDIAAHPGSVGFPEGHPPMRNLLLVPVSNGGVGFGVLYAAEKEGGEAFDDDDVAIAAGFASTLGFAVACARDRARQARLEADLLQAQKLESIGQLAAGIAHEINTPAQYVGDNLEFLEQSFGELGELLKRHQALLVAAGAGEVPEALVAEVREAAEAADVEFLEEEIPRALAQSREGIGRVSKIVRAMKDFSHPGSEQKQPIDLNRAIESTVTVARNEWKYVAELELELDDGLPPVPCLAAELNQVVLNIVVNAAHALGEQQEAGEGEGKGRIFVRTRSEGGVWAVVEIEDTGPGIPEEIRDRIFDPFFTTKEVGKGTGQGLAIARSIVVDKHGGTLEVASQTGQGTTFTIRLPIGDET